MTLTSLVRNVHVNTRFHQRDDENGHARVRNSVPCHIEHQCVHSKHASRLVNNSTLTSAIMSSFAAPANRYCRAHRPPTISAMQTRALVQHPRPVAWRVLARSVQQHRVTKALPRMQFHHCHPRGTSRRESRWTARLRHHHRSPPTQRQTRRACLILAQTGTV